MDTERSDAVAALVAYVEKLSAWIDTAVARIIPEGRGLADGRQFALAVDGEDRACVVQTVGSIDKRPSRSHQNLRRKTRSFKARRECRDRLLGCQRSRVRIVVEEN